MPLFFQKNINSTTKLAIWKIEESEAFFLSYVPLQTDITHPHKRLQHLAGRYLLRFLFPDFPQDEILIASTRKPFLPNEQYHFSISHCGDYAAAIVSSNQHVGIDIEIQRPTVAKVAHKFLNNQEKLMVDSWQLTESTIPHDFLLTTHYSLLTTIWCAKEAIFKWWGKGEVDFRQMIQLDGFTGNNDGEIIAKFIKNEQIFPLQLHYQIFSNLCLVWVLTDK